MATLSLDKAVARTVTNVSISAYLSKQLVRLSEGKSIEKNKAVDCSTFFKTVQALTREDSKRNYFYNSLALLIRDERFPLFTDCSVLADLHAIHQQEEVLSELEKLSMIFGNQTLVTNAYLYNCLVNDLRITGNKLVTLNDWSIILSIRSNQHGGIDTRIRFLLKFKERFSNADLLQSLLFGKRQTLKTIADFMTLFKRISGGELTVAATVISTFIENFQKNHSGLKQLGQFMHNVFPFFVNKLSLDLSKNIDANDVHDYFIFWKSSKSWSGQLSFYEVLRNIPVFALTNTFHLNNPLITALGGGQPIRTLLPNLSKKAAHYFLNYEGSIAQIQSILMAAIFKTFDGSQAILDATINRIQAHHLQLPAAQYRLLINFFMKYSQWSKTQSMERTGWEIMVEFALHIVHERPDFKLRGRTFNSIQKLAEAHFIRPSTDNRCHIVTEWTGAPYPDYKVVKEGRTYVITQLKTARDIDAEGHAMSHCLRSNQQGQLAASGIYTIWSLRVELNKNRWKSMVTIEIYYNKTIVQALGMCNQTPDPLYMKIIQRWAEKHYFELDLSA